MTTIPTVRRCSLRGIVSRAILIAGTLSFGCLAFADEPATNNDVAPGEEQPHGDSVEPETAGGKELSAGLSEQRVQPCLLQDGKVQPCVPATDPLAPSSAVPTYPLNVDDIPSDDSSDAAVDALFGAIAQSRGGGRFGAVPDVIGDLLRSGGIVRLNFRPEAIIPAGANPNGIVRQGDPTTLSYSDGSNNPTFPVAGNTFVFFRNSGGGALIPDANGDLLNLERVTSDGFGNESVESNFDLIAQAGGGFRSLAEQTGVVTAANPAFANVGIVKSAEGNNPVPRDRVFFNYSYFDNVPLGSTGGIGINRYTPGFEKTFLDGQASFEARFPFAATLDSDFNFTSGFGNATDQVEFGDILLALKTVFASGDDWLVSGGLQVSIPTADDLRFLYTGSVAGDTVTGEFLRIENDTVHILPVISGLYAPDDRLFIQGFLQVDFDARGKTVQLDRRPLSTDTSLTDIGRLNDSTFLYADVSAGYWLSKDPPRSTRNMTGFAMMTELHYNRSLTESDQVLATSSSQDIAQVGTAGRHFEVLNATVGGVFQFRHQTHVTVGFSTPILGGSNKEFDGELRVLLSHRFGGSR